LSLQCKLFAHSPEEQTFSSLSMKAPEFKSLSCIKNKDASLAISHEEKQNYNLGESIFEIEDDESNSIKKHLKYDTCFHFITIAFLNQMDVFFFLNEIKFPFLFNSFSHPSSLRYLVFGVFRI
jgi:hypothetical protein